ncbi:hypothetical protein B0T19DRAFT_432820 [Cercophora scortea]|uniref:Uncharacterized protein n=1 Tax=Cercophora scortea TaxID=314031 RepID=A0AAE0M557_9PEZI|nr:hypothetical protein B0T19DRAFT_432820 [Cercophora scortea]
MEYDHLQVASDQDYDREPSVIIRQPRVHNIRADNDGPERVVPRIYDAQPPPPQQHYREREGVRVVVVEPAQGGSPPNIRRPPPPRPASPPEEHRPGRWYGRIRVRPHGDRRRPSPPVIRVRTVERPWHAVQIYNTGPESPRHRHRQNTLAHLFEQHDVARDFFARGRGMMDFDGLRRRAEEDERNRTRYLQEQAERRVRAELAAAREALGMSRRRHRDERRPSRMREDRSSSASGHGGSDDDDHGPGRAYSRRRRKGKERAREMDSGDECCEKLLAFMRQEARVHRQWWDEMREWRLECVVKGHNLTHRRTRSASREDSDASHRDRRTHSGGDDHITDSHTNVFSRPVVLEPGRGMGESGNRTQRSRGRSRSASRRRESPRPRRVSLGFMFLDDGEVIDTPGEDLLPYPPSGSLKPHDTWLIRHMKDFYSKRVASRRFPVLSWRKRLSLAKFVRFELVPTLVEYKDKDGKTKPDEGTRKICTAQRWLLNKYDSRSYDHFEYTIDHPIPKNREWLSKMEGLVEKASPHNDCVVWVYIFERINYRFTVLLFILYAVIATAGGVAYGILNDDISTGLTLSAYVLGVVGGATAGIGISEYIGLEKPDNCTYAFDLVQGADEVIPEDESEGKDIVGLEPESPPP